MSATPYTRNDVALIVTKSGDKTRLSIGTRSVEVETATLAGQLAASIADAVGATPLPPPTIEGYGGSPVTLRRITIDIRDAALAVLPWEPAVRASLPTQLTPSDVVVRVSQVQPRARQIPLTFPLRVLEVVDNSQAHASGDLHAAFRGADWSSTMETGVASARHAEDFVRNRNWPTVDILQWSWDWSAGEDVLSAVPYQPGQETPENHRVYTLAWLEAMTALWQTRLVILEADLTYAPIFRRLAQRLVSRGGPAVLLLDRAAGTRTFYDFFVHDRPLDFIRMKYPPTFDVALFAGAGREDALRFSSIGDALSRPENVEAIREVVEPEIEVETKLTQQKCDVDTEAAIRHAMQTAGIVPDHDTIDFGALEEGQLIDAADLVEKHLGDSGYRMPKLADPFRSLKNQNAIVVVPELARSFGKLAKPSVFGRAATKIDIPGLDKVSAKMKDYRFDDHESEGAIPLSRDVRELRNAASPQIRASRAAAPSPTPERHINSAFYEIADGQDPVHLPQRGPRFTPGKTIHLGIQIGPKDKLTTSFGPTALLEEVFRWTREQRGVTIEIGVTPLDFELIGECVQQLWLSQSEPTDFVTFALQPKAKTAMPGVARLRFALYYRNHLIQSFRMALLLDSVPAAPNALADVLGLDRSDDAAGFVWGSRLEYANVASLADPKALPARSLTIIANESAGEDVITAKADDCFDVAVASSFTTLVENARLALKKASVTNNGRYRYYQKNMGTPADLEGAMIDLAEAGWAAYATFFQDKKCREGLRDKLEADKSVVETAHIDLTKVIPWSLMYDRTFDRKHEHYDNPADPAALPVPVSVGFCPGGLPDQNGKMPPGVCGTAPGCLINALDNAERRKKGEPIYCPETVACARNFWGFKYQIEAPAQQVKANGKPVAAASSIRVTAPAKVFVAMNRHLSFFSDHEKEIRAAIANANPQASLAVDPVPDRYSKIKAILGGDPQAAVIYFYCHGRGEQKQPNAPALLSALDFGKEAADGELLTGVDFDGGDWSGAPLVFMNGCGTAGFTDAAPSDLVTRFIQGRKASAVIGTEVTIWELLAGEMANLFLSRFLGGAPAGLALLQARRALLGKYNPLGLVYTLYGSANLRMEYEEAGKG
ncbi:MAG: hypothetical protein QOK37_3220 [Thermoanaerobaculia bacterium]|nr:hypothetical protein [Thermoanaerobaculia bacterium]